MSTLTSSFIPYAIGSFTKALGLMYTISFCVRLVLGKTNFEQLLPSYEIRSLEGASQPPWRMPNLIKRKCFYALFYELRINLRGTFLTQNDSRNIGKFCAVTIKYVSEKKLHASLRQKISLSF